MHVQQQIANAVAAAVAAVPDTFGGRVFTKGAIEWDGRTYPAAVVTTGKTTIVTKQSGTGYREGRVQTRTTEIVVEVHDLELDGADPVAKLTSIVALVEQALTASRIAVPLDDILLHADTGVSELETDEDGVHSAQALTFVTTYYTVEGHPEAFVEPNY